VNVSYIDQIKNCLQASIDAGLNAILISPPGWGKSKMAFESARSLYGDQVLFLELSPSTPPEVVEGAIDLAALREGRLARNIERTPYDPSVKLVILDELWRANEVVFDLLLHATQPVTRVSPPVFWGTSNFISRDKRFDALRDRFALWLWLEPVFTRDAILDSLDLALTPPGEPVMETAEARERAFQLAEQAIGSGFGVNPRIFGYWVRVFERCPNPLDALLYCYPLEGPDQASRWSEVISAIADPEAAAVQGFMATVELRLKDLDGMSRHDGIALFGELVAEAERALGGYEKGKEAVEVLKKRFLDYVAGGKS
jgi:hypothetical protein